MKNQMVWENKEHCPGAHQADHKWPVLEGGKCLKLSGDRCAHYFDNWRQAVSLGWKSPVPQKELAFKKR